MAAATGAITAQQVEFDNDIPLNMPSLTGVPTDGSAMIVAVFRQSAGPVASTGSVFTSKRTGADGNISIFYKRVAGGESATYSFTCALANIFSDALSFVVTGIPTTGDPFDSTPVVNFVNGTSSTNLSLTTGTANCLLVFVDAHNNASATTSTGPTSMTNRGANPTKLHVFDQFQAAAGGTGNKSLTTTATVNHYAGLMAIKSGIVNYTQSADLVGDGVTTRVLAATESRDVVGDGVTTRVLALTESKSLTGDGVVTETAAVAASKTTNLTGDGVVTRTLAGTVTRDLTGDGVLTSTKATVAAKTTDLVGEGVVTSAKAVTASKTTDLVGDGVVTEANPVGLARTFDLIGDGELTLSKATVVARTVDLVGDGSITRGPLPIVLTPTDLLGDGVVTSGKATTAARTFNLVGEGIITEIHPVGVSRTFDLVGDGLISGSADIPFPIIPECAGDWTPNDGLKSIAGTVLFHEPPNQGDPVSGATVCLFRDSDGVRIECTTTAPDGTYSFPRDTNDPYTYHVEVNWTDGGTPQQGLSQGGCIPQ